MEESNCLSCAGKYRPGLDQVNPKRWKANFRCALNSLSDVKEVPSMSRKNGADGYMVCRLTTNANQSTSFQVYIEKLALLTTIFD